MNKYTYAYRMYICICIHAKLQEHPRAVHVMHLPSVPSSPKTLTRGHVQWPREQLKLQP